MYRHKYPVYNEFLMVYNGAASNRCINFIYWIKNHGVIAVFAREFYCVLQKTLVDDFLLWLFFGVSHISKNALLFHSIKANGSLSKISNYLQVAWLGCKNCLWAWLSCFWLLRSSTALAGSACGDFIIYCSQNLAIYCFGALNYVFYVFGPVVVRDSPHNKIRNSSML